MTLPRYSVTFALLPRAHRDGSHSVALTVTWCSRRYRRTLPVACPPDCWDTSVQLARARGQFHASAAVNEAVLTTREQVDALFARCAAADTLPTPADLDRLFSAPPPEERRTLSATLAEFVSEQSRERSWQPGTRIKFAMLERELHTCGVQYLDELDEVAKGRFHDLHSSHGLRNSTLSKKLSILNWFLRWSNAKGYTALPVTKPHLRTIPRTVTYLEWDELLHFYTFDYGARHTALAHVRDVFCLCAFTGLRYSDAAALRWSDVDGDQLRLVTQKTAEPLTLPLNKYARTIIDRYTGTQGRILQAPVNQVANRLLKDAAMLAQLDRPVRQVFFRGSDRCEEVLLTFEDFSTHWARRTFVVHALRLGIPSEVVMRFTGHSGYTAMRPYVAIADELKAEAMRKFDDAEKI